MKLEVNFSEKENNEEGAVTVDDQLPMDSGDGFYEEPDTSLPSPF